MLAASLLVVHDTGRGGQDNVTELTGGKELGSPLLEVTELDGVAGVDNTTLVETEGMNVSSMFSWRLMDVIVNTYRPLSWMTILPERWSSTSSNSPM